MSVTTRRMRYADWQVAKALRLRALADAPDAFERSLAEEQAFDDARWQARARANDAGQASAGFFALHDAIEVGLAIGVRLPPEADAVELNGLWVEPALRRRGAARALVEAVRGWACELGVSQLVLEVTDDNQHAIAFYRSAGFEYTGAAVRCGVRQAPARRMARAARLPL